MNNFVNLMDTLNMVEELKILDEVTIFDLNAYYVIPRYQRAYAWEDKEIVQFIDDINDIESSKNYYIGSLIVFRVKSNPQTFEVVDGQQRLTTLFLLLQYLVSEGALVGTVGQTLSFDCRSKSKFTLSNIQQILTDKNLSDDYEENIDSSILNGIKAIRQKFTNDKGINKDDFVSRLKHVILFRIEVPEHTDLNRYFEIMNTRGEQLEQHDILKARLMRSINNRREQELFSRIWNSCSDMTGYVQMHFSRLERENIFGVEWNDWPSNDWDEYSDCLEITEDSENNATISEIIKPKFKVNNIDGILDDDHIRFESIIEFPYFLLHALRIFVELYHVSLGKKLGDLLDDKNLITDFDNVIKYGVLDGKPIKDNIENFVKMFIIHLLQTRYLFDAFIIKREFTGEDKEGEWSLKELNTSGQASKKKAYYSNTKLKYKNEWEKTYSPRNKECLMIQSALRVSYTSPKIMHWITDLLIWLFGPDENPLFIRKAEKIAAQAIQENFLDRRDYKLGVTTPHIVFNFLDYLLWKNNKNKYADFEFEFRNSVEHWYPQNPSDGSFDSWNDKDTFGNLCIISRSVNSKFSNLSPESKMKSYGKIVKKGSLKLRIMGDIIEKGSNDKWIKTQCEKHECEMIEILEMACRM